MQGGLSAIVASFLRERGHTPCRSIDRRQRPFGETQHEPDVTLASLPALADLLLDPPPAVARRAD